MLRTFISLTRWTLRRAYSMSIKRCLDSTLPRMHGRTTLQTMNQDGRDSDPLLRCQWTSLRSGWGTPNVHASRLIRMCLQNRPRNLLRTTVLSRNWRRRRDGRWARPMRPDSPGNRSHSRRPCTCSSLDGGGYPWMTIILILARTRLSAWRISGCTQRMALSSISWMRSQSLKPILTYL